MVVNQYSGVGAWALALTEKARLLVLKQPDTVFLPDSPTVSENIVNAVGLFSIGASVVLCAPCQREQVLEGLGARCSLVSRLIDAEEECNFQGGEAFSIDFVSAPIPSDSSRVIIATSGTTGVPKFVEHKLGPMLSNMKSPATSSVTWGLTYAYYKFAGLQVWLQALKGKARLNGLESTITGGNTTKLALHLEKSGVTHVSTTPSLLRQLLAARFSSDCLAVVTLGGEMADQGVLSAAATAFPQSKLRHIYASTELGAVFTVADGLEGIPKEMLEGNDRFKLDDRGELLVRPAAGHPQCYQDESLEFLRDGRVATGDILRKVGDRYLFQGRSASVVNVGGNKVLPEKIEQFLLRSFSELGDATVRGISSPFLGSVLSAELVVDADCDTLSLKKRIQDKCNEELASHERPVKYAFSETMELNESGKKKR